jgi:hypothetical protein
VIRGCHGTPQVGLGLGEGDRCVVGPADGGAYGGLDLWLASEFHVNAPARVVEHLARDQVLRAAVWRARPLPGGRDHTLC